MKTTTDNHIDKLLHEAMKQRAAKVPPLADDFADKVLGSLSSLTPRPLQKKRELKFWPLVVAACMVGFVVIFLAPPKSTEEQSPLALEEPEVNSQESRVESQEPRASSRLSTQPSPKGGDGGGLSKAKRRKQVVRQEPVEEPLLAEAQSVPFQEKEELAENLLLAEAQPSPFENRVEEIIPPDRQALVDIYLAEEALQVAYMQQEQTRELRAFTARLQGKEPETSHLITSF